MRCSVHHLAARVLSIERLTSITNIPELAGEDVAALRLNADGVITLTNAESDEVDLNVGFTSEGLEHGLRGKLDAYPKMKLKTPHDLVTGLTSQHLPPYLF